MKYEIVWSAVDNLAKSLGLSPSGLAKKSGLDATTFNKSKRIRPDGKNRWPSLESLNKIFEYCNICFEDFYKFGDKSYQNENLNMLPMCKISEFMEKNAIYGSEIDTNDWEAINFPDGMRNFYALELDSDQYAPYYRFGTTLILNKNPDVRHNDRIALFMNDKTVVLAEFIHRKPKTMELRDLNDAEKIISLPLNSIRLINRIVWASQ